MNFNELHSAFYNDGYRLAQEYLSQNQSEDNFIKLSEKTYKYIDYFIDLLITEANKQNTPVECRKGCAKCCYQPVFMLPYEAIFIIRFLNKYYKEKITDIKLMCEKKHNITSVLSPNKLLSHRQECPFLRKNTCIIYPARPMACRIYLSYSQKSCENSFNNPEDKAIYPRLLEIALKAGQYLNEGIAKFLSEKKIKVFEFTIESMMTHVLSKNNFFNNWLNGEYD